MASFKRVLLKGKAKGSRKGYYWFVRDGKSSRYIKASGKARTKKGLSKYLVIKKPYKKTITTTTRDGKTRVTPLPVRDRTPKRKVMFKFGEKSKLRGFKEVWYKNPNGNVKGWLHLEIVFIKGQNRYVGRGRSRRRGLKSEFEKAYNEAWVGAWINSGIGATQDQFIVRDIRYVYYET